MKYHFISITFFYARITQEYLINAVSYCNLPFIWDDPSDKKLLEDVAVQLSSGAVRGTFAKKLRPRTGCLVTSNVSLDKNPRYVNNILLESPIIKVSCNF